MKHIDVEVLEPGDLAELTAAVKSAQEAAVAAEREAARTAAVVAQALTALEERVAALEAAEQPAPPARKSLTVGVQYPAEWPGVVGSVTVREQMCATARGAGAGWVRLDVAWASFQPNSGTSFDETAARRIEGHIDIARAAGLKVLLEVYWPPQWANGSTDRAVVPKDPADVGRFMSWLATRYRGKVSAYEVWNEQNNTRFLRPSTPAAYVPVLKAAYAAVKAVDPTVPVVVGGVEYVDTAWLTGFYAAGGKGHYDVMACHPYPGLSDSAPDGVKAWDKWNPLYVDEWVKVMAAHGDTSPIWFTELGWSTHANTGSEPNWSRGVTEQQQADFSARMVELAATRWTQVEGVFFYTVRDTHETDVQQASYGLMRRDNTHKPAVAAIGRAVTEHG